MAKSWIEKTSNKIKREAERSHRAYIKLVTILQKHNTNLYDLKTCKNWSVADQKEFLEAMTYEGYDKNWTKRIYSITINV